MEIMKYNLLIVGLSGFAGSVTRYLINVWFFNRNLTIFPWATLTINISGCLVMGVLSVLVERLILNHKYLYLAGSVGFLGAFTTFSAFGLETFSLLRGPGINLALINIFSNVIFGVSAVWLGRFLATFF